MKWVLLVRVWMMFCALAFRKARAEWTSPPPSRGTLANGFWSCTSALATTGSCRRSGSRPRRLPWRWRCGRGTASSSAAAPSLDAVEATIRVLENSGDFDAGRGGYYPRQGVPELDAAIMDGRTLAAGAVASVKHIANPIHLARMVMEKTRHVLLVGEGAEEFAQSQGIELVSPYHFYSEREWERFQKARAAEEKPRAVPAPGRPEGNGTVGVVALDKAGNLAAGTSTGGTVLKMPGRVGDSPLIGAGTYANNESCAVSATGTGEFFIRQVVAADICMGCATWACLSSARPKTW